jgi:hypothetical protein
MHLRETFMRSKMDTHITLKWIWVDRTILWLAMMVSVKNIFR